jgi:hypothetical protein
VEVTVEHLMQEILQEEQDHHKDLQHKQEQVTEDQAVEAGELKYQGFVLLVIVVETVKSNIDS